MNVTRKYSVRWGPLLAASALALVFTSHALATDAAAVFLNQGKAWTADTRADFYSRDQGSRIMPLRWIVALKQANGLAFMADSLSRYGYLQNESSTPRGLPVGFTVASTANGEVIGMTCAACHTRQITLKGKVYRIDGGPAIVDFQSFLADLDAAVGAVLTDASAFATFAAVVLSPSASPDQVVKLKDEVEAWYLPYHTLMDRALPEPPWGPGRLDAVSMIFNRLAGLDIGPPPTYMIPDNIKRADAPVRYPFLWNSTRQDRTQWPGFANNGNTLLGLARNLGEVTGVFAVFHPRKEDGHLFGINFVGVNSANFQGLEALERMVEKIDPPKWPWAVSATLAAQGKKVFERTCAVGCHEIKIGEFRSPFRPSWATPIKNIGTDTREWSILERAVDPGILIGAAIPGVAGPLVNPAAPKEILGLAVVGSIIQHTLPLVAPSDQFNQVTFSSSGFNPEADALKRAFQFGAVAPVRGSYEARVLQGVWATAPYLHNGSVPTLADLLKPAAERPVSFKIGPAYDSVNIGLAIEQTAFSQTLQTTDCNDVDSGNSRCGHEYGTGLSPSQKRALLEYLKIL